METVNETRRETNQISRCRRCKKVQTHAVVVVTKVRTIQNDRMVYPLRTRTVHYEYPDPAGRYPRCCNQEMLVRVVEGRRTAQPCGAKCLASKGPSCECSCGGKNHGGAYAVAG